MADPITLLGIGLAGALGAGATALATSGNAAEAAAPKPATPPAIPGTAPSSAPPPVQQPVGQRSQLRPSRPTFVGASATPDNRGGGKTLLGQ